MDDRLRQLMAAGREHYEKKEYDQAEPYLVAAVEANPGFADLHNMLGVIYHGKGLYLQAQEAFENALAINPSYTEAALNLAVTCNDLGKYDQAREVYARTLAASRSQPKQLDRFARGKLANMHAGIGDAYVGLGLLEDAADEFQKAIKLAPDFPDLRTKLAQTFRDMGRPQDALKQLDQAVAVNSRYVPARIHRGLALYALGRKEEAAQEWEDVLSMDPGNKSCRLYLEMLK